jgi:excisionase family DNA binding protein
MSPDFLTADQAAERIGVNRRTITKWSDTGRLPEAMRLPGSTGARLFHPDEVERVAAEYAASLAVKS